MRPAYRHNRHARKSRNKTDYKGGVLSVFGGLPKGGTTFDGVGDHRMVMASAVFASALEPACVIKGAEHVSKSYPDFLPISGGSEVKQMSVFNGKRIKAEIYGASRGEKIGVKISGLDGFSFDENKLKDFLKRRSPSDKVYSTARKERDIPVFPAKSQVKSQVKSRAELRVKLRTKLRAALPKEK